MNGPRVVRILLLIAIVFSGCGNNRSVDPVLLQFELIGDDIPPRADANDVKARLEKARLQWQNGEIDPEPVIFYAMFISPRPGPYALWVSIFDEDKDMVGLGIRQERIGQNGQRIVRQEQYPVYVHIAPFFDELLRESVVPVRIRDAGQAMDAQQWANYMRAEAAEAGEGVFSKTAYLSSHWEETLPPVWISFPDPNAVDVYAPQRRLPQCAPSVASAAATTNAAATTHAEGRSRPYRCAAFGVSFLQQSGPSLQQAEDHSSTALRRSGRVRKWICKLGLESKGSRRPVSVKASFW